MDDGASIELLQDVQRAAIRAVYATMMILDVGESYDQVDIASELHDAASKWLRFLETGELPEAEGGAG
jgi:hypothetical protein